MRGSTTKPLPQPSESFRPRPPQPIEGWEAIAASLADDDSWTARRWTTVKEMATAFMVGYVEATLWEQGKASQWLVPRYLERVCNQLVTHLLGLVAGQQVVEVAPLQVAHMLRNFAVVHALVREWPVDHDVAARNAGNYLRGKAVLEEEP